MDPDNVLAKNFCVTAAEMRLPDLALLSQIYN